MGTSSPRSLHSHSSPVLVKLLSLDHLIRTIRDVSRKDTFLVPLFPQHEPESGTLESTLLISAPPHDSSAHCIYFIAQGSWNLLTFCLLPSGENSGS